MRKAVRSARTAVSVRAELLSELEARAADPTLGKGGQHRQREAAVVASIMRYLATLPQCRVEKTQGTRKGRRGKPDLSGTLAGRSFYLEVKRPGKEATPLQAAMLEHWRQVGAIVGVVHSVEEVQRLLSPYLTDESSI